MSSLRAELPSVKSLPEARIVIAELYDFLTSYGRVLGTVLPALEGHPQLHKMVEETLNP